MNGKSQNEKIILGLKVRQFRSKKGFSLNDLHQKSSLSVSYLNEIEKGKKYPKEDKLELLAVALETSYEELVSTELPHKLEPIRLLLDSNFLNDLPLELFHIELTKVVEIIATAPAQVGAFISTLVDLSRNYEMQQESFYFAALRSYLELHNNYFEELEEKVRKCIVNYDLPTEGLIPSKQLAQVLEKKFKYKIIYDGLDEYPDLQKFRSVYLPKGKKLLLNSQLTDRQRAFQFGKELGFKILNIKERATTSSLLRATSFNEVLNHSKVIYFSVALLINEMQFSKDVQSFFRRQNWDGKAFIELMLKYGASPEMFYHRLTNILPKFFNLDKIFFIRFVHQPQKDHFEIDRELHLDEKRHPHRNELSEHYCRRWIAISSLNELKENPSILQDNGFHIAVQRSQYFETPDEYLCITISRTAYPSPNKNVSVTLGLLVNEKLREQLQFLEDISIPRRVVNKTCERCSILDCKERVAPPTVIEKREKRKRIQRMLEKLSED